MQPHLTLTQPQREILSDITKSRTERQDHITRSHIILLCSDGLPDVTVGKKLSLSNITVGKWRKRWTAQQAALLEIENKQDVRPIDYKRYIKSLLSDAARPGTPPKFTEEQICQILSIACEKPEDSGLPLSHWSLSSLAQELKKRGVVDSISINQLSLFLKSGQAKAP